MAEIKEEIMQVLTQMRAEHKTAVEAATKSGEAMSAEAKANIATMNKAPARINRRSPYWTPFQTTSSGLAATRV